MQKKPKFTVLVSAYNAEKYIKDAVTSILTQDYEGIIHTIVLLDLGTTDKTDDILRSFILKRIKNRPITIIRHPHTFLFRALLIGMNKSDGEITLFLDYDNKFKKEHISDLYKLSIETKFKFAFSNAELIDKNGKKLHSNLISNFPKHNSFSSLVIGNYIDLNTIAIRKDLQRKLIKILFELDDRFYDYLHTDYLIALISSKLTTLIELKKIGVLYRSHRSNVTYGNKNKLFTTGLELRSLLACYTHSFYNLLNAREKLFLNARIYLLGRRITDLAKYKRISLLTKGMGFLLRNIFL